MSDFPAIKPTARSFTPGKLPESTFKSLSGKETRVIFADKYSGHKLSLSFVGMTEAEADAITQHYLNSMGTAMEFELPVEVWAGWMLYGTLVKGGQKWRYEAPPSIETIAPSIMTIGVQLVGLA